MEVKRSGRPRSERLDQAILKAAIELAFEVGFRALSLESIAAKAGVGKTTIYRRWPNKAAVVMDAFMTRFGSKTLFSTSEKFADSVRLQMRTMARAFGGKDGALIRALLSEAQFDPELATAFRERWTLPRRKLGADFFREGVRKGELRPDIDLETMIDLLYAPLYYRLQVGTGPLSDAYIDGIFHHAMEGLRNSSPDPLCMNRPAGKKPGNILARGAKASPVQRSAQQKNSASRRNFS